VDRNDDFFLIGGDSMRAARMFVEISRRLGIDRPVSLLVEAPTIASLALMLSDDASAWDALLAVRTEGSKPPLFVVHDGVGSVLYARGLAAALGPDQPIYGLRCEALNGSPVTEGSYAELAATYVRRIQALYPDGPYVLYGVSLGGVIALEMARQLIESGNDVPLVALGDTIAPGPHVRPIPRAERHAGHVQTLRQSDWPQRLEYVFGLVRRTLAYRVWEAPRERRVNRKEDRRIDLAVARGEPIPPSLRGRHVKREYGRLLAGHEARPPFPSRVLLLRTDGPFDTPDRGWGPIVGSALEIVDLPGTHNDLGREASGAYVGPALSRELARAAPGPSAQETMALSGQGAS
jgi:thioesterase domain-containing protein